MGARLVMLAHPKAPDVLCDLDERKLARVQPDDELAPARVAGILGIKPDELGDLVDAGALKARRRNPGGSDLITGDDLHRFANRLEEVEFEETDGDEGTDQEDAEEESVPVLLIPLRKLRDLLRGGGDGDQAAAMLTPVGDPHASAPAVTVAVAPAAATPAATATDAPPTATPDGRQRNPRALPDRPRRRRADGGR